VRRRAIASRGSFRVRVTGRSSRPVRLHGGCEQDGGAQPRVQWDDMTTPSCP
jgi:hypothetical protein